MPYKKIAFFTVVIVLLLTINNLVGSIYTIWQKQDLIIQAQNNLAAEKEENQKLKKEISQVNQPEFIESEARNKLLLTKPGEGIIILPQNEFSYGQTSVKKEIDNRPDWQKWWEIFFKS
jgi:cell division protein FtsB